MHSNSGSCLEHPLGILCRCKEYQEVSNKFMYYSIGTQHCLLPRMNVEPIASAKVLWVKNPVKVDEDFTKPIINYSREKLNVNAQNVDRMWIPVIPDLIPLKFIKLKL